MLVHVDTWLSLGFNISFNVYLTLELVCFMCYSHGTFKFHLISTNINYSDLMNMCDYRI
jgi:hypothetical protein